MSDFTREIPAFRLVASQFGDDLQAVAAREMGDANRWVELIWLNDLVHPYITDDPRRAGPNVLLTGALLRVPAPVGVSTDTRALGQVYERDCALHQKRLMLSDTGDLAVSAGADNLRQQLEHRVNTPRGQARRHPEYGCLIWQLLGTVNGPAAGLLGSEYVRSAMAAEYRVSSIGRCKAQIIGDAIKVTANITAIDGGYVDLEVNTSATPT